MAGLTREQVESIVAACRENADALAESLNVCFDRPHRIEVEEPRPWSEDSLPEGSDGPGLTIALGCGEAGIVCLLPESLPLPEWYGDAGENAQSRLQTLAMEWSVNMLPADLEADASMALVSSELRRDVQFADSEERPTLLELKVTSAPESGEPQSEDPSGGEEEDPLGGEEAGDAESSRASIVVALPVIRPAILMAAGRTKRQKPAANSPADPATAAEGSPATNSAVLSPRDRRLLNLPVTVSVRLAEKRIELRQLLNLTPGALITFAKSCEQPLDLFVNNRLYCRGEAVKIGEKFGLKIDETGVKRSGKQ